MTTKLCKESFLPERLPPRDVGILISYLCTLALQNPDAYSDQLINRATKWQCHPSGLHDQDPWNRNDKHRRMMAKRVFGELQVHALTAARALVILNVKWSPSHLLGITKESPNLLDLLLDCTILEPCDVNPESAATSLACEILCALFRWPSEMIPGVSTSESKAFGLANTKTLSQSMKLLTSQKRWAERLVEAWAASGAWLEGGDDLQRRVAAVKSLYDGSRCPYMEDVSETIYEIRSYARISILRLIATMTHCADAAGVKNVDIYSLLPVAYQASLRNDIAEHPLVYDICDLPTWTKVHATRDDHFDPFIVAPEYVLGPTAFARLLVILAQRNALKTVQLLQKAPEGLSPHTSLAQIQQITHPDIIRRFLEICVLRTMDYSRETLQSGDATTSSDSDALRCDASFGYTAELAAAVVAFHNLTDGAYTSFSTALRARYLLVVSLGSVAKYSMQVHQHRRAYFAALAALDLNMNSAPDQRVEAGYIREYEKLAREAEVALDSKSSVQK
ncbi:hypothetical protein CONPUDRAFT_168022 [Coniophora puteana RWD-64-598 SS2]|uniref:Uncharacterized protein n=1 Tax=Coniophora puteana (strain RWD-64-598) TaxID=741705 RepID=A0A5M3MH32_CONPW|nr:uncharacterized protein CONPUDRAFT_168022 [Coniophora puteana RWD-64-598 SS2]EIW78084.1 hypothetical protein CONPUDRAFT_168022 [Coniophora puteana RWD-64-598 SS2]